MADDNAPKNDAEDNEAQDSESDENIIKVDDDKTEVTLENGGIVKKILTPGTGWEKPPKGAEVKVHYIGTLEDGTKFDSSRDGNDPFVFKLGEGQVIKGWDTGVATMKKGEKSLLICKPEYAYGTAGSPPKIPPNATLHFEIELFSWSTMEKVTDDGKVMKKVLEAGEGWKTPKELAKVNVKARGKVQGAKKDFFQHDGELDLGDPTLPWGLTEGLQRTKKGEKVLLLVDPEYGYGAVGDKKLGIPPNASLEYEIALIDFNNPKDSWELAKKEKVEYGVRLKECGNAMFKAQQYSRAKKYYESAAKLFEFEKDLEADVQTAADKLKADSHSNTAACAFHLKDWLLTIKECNEALKVDPAHTKSLYRRAQAKAHLGDNEDALRDLQRLQEAIKLKEEKQEPIGVEQAAVDKFSQAVKARVAKGEKKQRKIYGGFFDKVSLVSDEEVRKAHEKKPDPPSDSDDEPMPEIKRDDEAGAVPDVTLTAEKGAVDKHVVSAVPAQTEEPINPDSADAVPEIPVAKSSQEKPPTRNQGAKGKESGKGTNNPANKKQNQPQKKWSKKEPQKTEPSQPEPPADPAPKKPNVKAENPPSKPAEKVAGKSPDVKAKTAPKPEEKPAGKSPGPQTQQKKKYVKKESQKPETEEGGPAQEPATQTKPQEKLNQAPEALPEAPKDRQSEGSAPKANDDQSGGKQQPTAKAKATPTKRKK